MAKKKAKKPTSQPPPTPVGETPWYKKTWPWITGTAVVVAWVLLNGLTAISNAERFPSAISRLYTKASIWFQTDQEWTGMWTNEGEIDARYRQDIYVDLDLVVQSGGVGGTIASGPQRDAIPLEYVLVQGTVAGKNLELLAYDYFQGHRREIAKFNVSRIDSDELDQIKLVTTWQSQPWFPKEATLWRNGDSKLLPDLDQEK